MGEAEQWWAGQLEGTRLMPVPASYNDIGVEADLRDLLGKVEC